PLLFNASRDVAVPSGASFVFLSSTAAMMKDLISGMHCTVKRLVAGNGGDGHLACQVLYLLPFCQVVWESRYFALEHIYKLFRYNNSSGLGSWLCVRHRARKHDILLTGCGQGRRSTVLV